MTRLWRCESACSAIVNWVGFNYARDFTLAGMKDGPIGFLMYPYAETPDGNEDSLDPTTFAYVISSKEIA